MGFRPEDFGLCYSWREGSIPPPYHYEFTISVSPTGDGTVVFCPDYPEHSPPLWKEQFRVSAMQLDALYDLMLKKSLFTTRWETCPEPQPVGGSLEWLEVVVNNEKHLVPSLLQQPEAVQEIYVFIRDLVPKTTWAKLQKQHEHYQATYHEKG